MIVTAIYPLWVLPIIRAVIRVFVIFYTNVMMRVVSKMSVVVKFSLCLPRLWITRYSMTEIVRPSIFVIQNQNLIRDLDFRLKKGNTVPCEQDSP